MAQKLNNSINFSSCLDDCINFSTMEKLNLNIWNWFEKLENIFQCLNNGYCWFRFHTNWGKIYKSNIFSSWKEYIENKWELLHIYDINDFEHLFNFLSDYIAYSSNYIFTIVEGDKVKLYIEEVLEDNFSDEANDLRNSVQSEVGEFV